MMEKRSSCNNCIFLVIYLLKKKNTGIFETLNFKFFSGAAYLPDPPNLERHCRSNLSFVRTPSKSHAAPLFNWKLPFDSYVGACVAPTMLEELCKWIQHSIYKIRCSDLKANNVGSWFHWNFEHFDAVILWSERVLSNGNFWSVCFASFCFYNKNESFCRPFPSNFQVKTAREIERDWNP